MSFFKWFRWFRALCTTQYLFFLTVPLTKQAEMLSHYKKESSTYSAWEIPAGAGPLPSRLLQAWLLDSAFVTLPPVSHPAASQCTLFSLLICFFSLKRYTISATFHWSSISLIESWAYSVISLFSLNLRKKIMFKQSR